MHSRKSGASLTQERLFELLKYNPSSGLFFWKLNRRGKLNKGDIAGSINGNGYVVIRIDGKLHYAHRLAWLYCNGSFPDFLIDHANGITSDNRLINLRKSTHSENQCNRRKPSSNSSGIKGIHWNSHYKKWHATIEVNGKRFDIGRFSDIKKAKSAIRTARNKLHGDFANHGL